ncbi:hypothetical protein ACIBEH_32765 [Nocardia salmonicida]|uniref:hypothetical protein n=1 Tax=Nocardia salmonicida TaxID=53431 RepID=UPI0037AB3798
MTRRSPGLDRVGRDVVNRDIRNRVGAHLASATQHVALLEDLLWILERADDPDAGVDTAAVMAMRRLLAVLRTDEVLGLLAHDPQQLRLLDKFCRGCGADFTGIRRKGRGRPRQHCSRACRTRAYRLRLSGGSELKGAHAQVAAGMAELLHILVVEMKQADSTLLANQILATKVREMERRRRGPRRMSSSGERLWHNPPTSKTSP